MSHSYQSIVAAAALSTLAAGALGDGVEEVNAQFARDLYASKASILIIGDSTAQPRGASTFVTYYEGLIQTLPSKLNLCGFRVSGSAGNSGVNNYIRFFGDSQSVLVGGVREMTEGQNVGSTPHAPPGYRNEIQLRVNESLPSSVPFASVGLTNLAGIYPHSDSWIQDSKLVLRTPFYVSSDGSLLSKISMSQLSDHDALAGLAVNLFESGIPKDVQLDTNRFGLQAVDSDPFINPASARIGVQFAGDIDNDDSAESGKVLAWTDHILFNENTVNQENSIYLDSISIGGYTAKDHADGIDPELFDDYFSMAPKPYNYVLVWLGQNAELEEWNGTVQPIWGNRIELIADLAIQAGVASGSETPVVPILVTPPQATGTYPLDRFVMMGLKLDEIASRRGWGHLNLQELVGDSVANVNPDYIERLGPHPSQSGVVFLGSLIFEHLNCLQADFNGDEKLDFLDISEFLSFYTSSDPRADMNGDGSFDFLDISTFIGAYSAQCP